MSDDVEHPLDRQASLLDQWVETRRQINALEAQASSLLSERLALLDDDAAALPLQRETMHRSMVCEYAAAGRMAKASAETLFGDARILGDFPALRDSFQAGRVTAAHVRHVLRTAATVLAGVNDGTIEASVLGLFEAAAVEVCETESPGRANAHLRELAAALSPEAVVSQQRRGERERRVWMRSFDDGVSILHLILPTVKAVAIMDRTRAIARDALASVDPSSMDFVLPVDWDAEFAAWQDGDRTRAAGTVETYTAMSSIRGEPDHPTTAVAPESICDADDGGWEAYEAACDAAIAAGPAPIQLDLAVDDRTLDQVHADTVCDLLLGSEPTSVIGTGLEGITARVQVTVSGSTLAGLDDHAAQLDGHGPIDPDFARTLAGENTGWTRLFLDPSGLIASTDTYTPTAAMQRFLRARDQHCRFPGCRQPVQRSQIDHTHDYALGGPTDIHNLAHLCLTHHALKHPDIPDRYRWTAVQHPDWTITWTSPTARTYVDAPPRRVMFAPSVPEPDGP